MGARVISFHYTLTDPDGQQLDSSQGGEPLTYLEGRGQMIPGLEAELVKLKQGDIQTEITKTGDGFRIKLSSETLQKDVFLFTTEKGKFHDNFFDILPNEVMLIYFKTEAEHLDDLQLKTFNNFIR